MTGGNRRKPMGTGGSLHKGISLRIVAYVYFYLVLFAILANLGALKTVVFGGETEAAYIQAVERLNVFVEVMVVPLVLTFLALCIHGYFFSRRLAGPIDRIKGALQQVREGNLAAAVTVRDEDYFHDLCDELNGLCSQLRKDFGACRELSTRLADVGEALSNGGGVTEETKLKLVEMANTTTKLRRLVEGYRLIPEVVDGTDAPAGNALEAKALPAK